MSNFDPKKYNDITYQLSQALLWKVTDGLFAVSVESKGRKLSLTVYLDLDKTSRLDDKLMLEFEIEARERLPDYEIELEVKKVALDNKFLTMIRAVASYFKEDSFRCDIFLRFNKLWW